MKKTLIGATTLAALIAFALILHRSGVPTGADTSVRAAAEVTPSPHPGFKFTPLAKPRLLPQLQFVDGEGRVLSLADFRGKVVLLNIWATWCPPCRAEMPTLDRLQAKLGGPGFEVLALSIDQEGVPLVKAFYQEVGLKALRIYIEESGMSLLALNVVGLPATLLIDPRGREIGRTLGPAEWDSPGVITVIRRYLDAASAGTLGLGYAEQAAGDSNDAGSGGVSDA